MSINDLTPLGKFVQTPCAQQKAGEGRRQASSLGRGGGPVQGAQQRAQRQWTSVVPAACWSPTRLLPLAGTYEKPAAHLEAGDQASRGSMFRVLRTHRGAVCQPRQRSRSCQDGVPTLGPCLPPDPGHPLTTPRPDLNQPLAKVSSQLLSSLRLSKNPAQVLWRKPSVMFAPSFSHARLLLV